MHRLMLIVPVTALLAGCFGSSDYIRPDLPTPAAWLPASPDTGNGRVAALTAWQDFFPDPRLQALIAAALDHNRDMRIAVGRLETARAEYGVARAETLPSINATLSQSVAGMPANIAGKNEPSVSRRADIGIGVVSFELDLWNRLGSLSASARANYLASEAAQRGVRLALIAEVANTYFAQLELTERLSLGRQTLALREQALHLISLARDEGFASNLDKLGASTTLEINRSEMAQLERQLVQIQNKLQYLVGDMPTSLPAGRHLEAQAVDGALATGLPSETLLARPDVIEAEQRLRAAHANVDAARAAFLPKILLTAGLGLASGSLTSLLGAAGSAWNFQPTINMPIFDWGRNQGNLDAASARRNVAVAEYEKTLQEAFREVADLLATRRALLEQMRSLEAQLAIHRERVDIMEARREAGTASLLNVLDARRELLATQQSLLQTRRQQLDNAAQLYKALGGGELINGDAQTRTQLAVR